MDRITILLKTIGCLGIVFLPQAHTFSQNYPYPVVDTEVSEFFSNDAILSSPVVGSAFFGQDACYEGNQPSYTDNGDGTISDQVTGLMWTKDMGEKISYYDAFVKADTLTLGGHTDWRVPDIKELYSLILFTGRVRGATFISKFIDEDFFIQPIGNTDIGEREIDAQTWSSTQYVGLTMHGDSTVFGVNFIDGRIKGYPQYQPGSGNTIPKTMYFRMVRGNAEYGNNDFEKNDNGTISDHATGLMWQAADDGILRNWEEALQYAENLELGTFDDWRLPNAKELQSIVDYGRSPQTTRSPAIDPLFSCTEIDDPDGNSGQYAYYWTGTTHQDGVNPYSSAVYVAFGEAQGVMNDKLLDVHGAGAQRSDPKSGSIDDYPQFFGPQGDVRYVYNAVRCVRDLESSNSVQKDPIHYIKPYIYPNPTRNTLYIKIEDDLDHSAQMINIYGKILGYWDFKNNTTIDVSQLRPGFCFLRIDNLLSEKFLVQ